MTTGADGIVIMYQCIISEVWSISLSVEISRLSDNMAHAKRLTAREAARLNAIECLYYGASRQHWNSCGLNPEEAEKVWQEAREQLANE